MTQYTQGRRKLMRRFAPTKLRRFAPMYVFNFEIRLPKIHSVKPNNAYLYAKLLQISSKKYLPSMHNFMNLMKIIKILKVRKIKPALDKNTLVTF